MPSTGAQHAAQGRPRRRAGRYDERYGRRYLRLRRLQVHLVQHRHDCQPLLKGQEEVGHRLRLHPLAGVHQQQRSLARSQRAGDLL
jgi:hypothetical protein